MILQLPIGATVMRIVWRMLPRSRGRTLFLLCAQSYKTFTLWGHQAREIALR
jgi:hypothetical protein